MVFATTFKLSAKDAKIYTLFISEMTGNGQKEDSIPAEYRDLQEVFSEESLNELPDHKVSDMKIEFKEGQEPKNTGLQPMSSVELEEL